MLYHAKSVLSEIWVLWLDMGVYLVFGFAIAGILSRMLKRDAIARHLGANSLGSVTKASLFGIPLPLCSCGVIPVGLSLRNRGASRGAATAFLISTPQTGVDSIAVTWGFLGPIFAIARPIAALLNGLLGGGIVTWLDRNRPQDAETTSTSTFDSTDCDECDDAEQANGRVSLAHHAMHAFRYGFVDFPREIVGWLLVGIVAAGVIAHLLPDENALLEAYLGTGLMPMVVMAVVGVPLYICATASVPIVAVLVVQGGLSAGGALVFLMTGPATNVATLMLLAKTLGRRAAISYLGSIVVTSFICGLALDAYFAASGSTLAIQAMHHGEHSMLGDWVQMAGAVGLALIIAGGFWGNFVARQARRRAATQAPPEGETMDIQVEGMTCGNCAAHVEKAAQAIEGVESARVDLKKGLVAVAGKSPDRQLIVEAIRAAGYQVVDA